MVAVSPAEISEQAYKPGADIFQSGALLGSYDYENTEDCLDGLNKVDGLFQLFFLVLNKQYSHPGYLESNHALVQKLKDRDSDFCRTMAQNHILKLLNLIKDLLISWILPDPDQG